MPRLLWQWRCLHPRFFPAAPGSERLSNDFKRIDGETYTLYVELNDQTGYIFEQDTLLENVTCENRTVTKVHCLTLGTWGEVMINVMAPQPQEWKDSKGNDIDYDKTVFKKGSTYQIRLELLSMQGFWFGDKVTTVNDSKNISKLSQPVIIT